MADEASDPDSPFQQALDPSTIVVVPALHPELDPERKALFLRFHEEILRHLRAVPGLNVAPSDVVELFLQSGTPEEEIARHLGAAHLVVLWTTSLSSDEEVAQRVLQKLLDETLPVRERLMATLIVDGANARAVPLTTEAARAVFDIGVTATDPDIRGSAWSTLGRNDVDDPAFTNVLLDDLASYPDDEVRVMAA